VDGLKPPDVASEAGVILREGLSSVALRLLDPEEPEVREAVALFREAAVDVQKRALAADFATHPLLSSLSERDIPWVIIKGPAVGRFHPPGWPRPYNDLDILLSSHDFAAAVEMARRLGFAYPDEARPPREWVDRYCREGVNLHGSANLDIHHHVPPWVFGSRLPPDEVIGAADEASLEGMTVRLASRSHGMVVAALHVLNDLWKGRLALTSWRDLVVLLHATTPAEAAATFAGAGLDWLLGLVTAALERGVPEASIEAIGAVQPPPWVARRLKILGWEGTSFVSRHRSAWLGRLPVTNAMAYLAATAVPQHDYIRSRHGSYPRYWMRAWQETVFTAGGADFRTAGGSPRGRRRDATVA
jgi:hypothetical protein